MNESIQFVLALAIFISLSCSVWFSLRSRRSDTMKKRGTAAARMNISMGIMLLFISAVQLLLSETSTLRIVMGAIFMLLGVFNLFAGLRNLRVYSQLKEEGSA